MPLPDEVIDRLRVDHELYAKRCLKVVDEDAELVPLVYRPAQQKVAAAIKWQRDRGLPVRINVGKSRKTGVSTGVQGIAVEETTLNRNRRALIVAHDATTSGELFDIANTMYANLPGHLDPRLKPKIAYFANSLGRKMMWWGNKAAIVSGEGDRGIDSRLNIDTAQEVEGGRGKTIHFLHCSEIAFWPDAKKALALLNAVPDRPTTTVICESTANGFNFWKSHWDRAARGEGRFINVFIGWLEDPQCTAAFPHPDARAQFIEGIGKPSSSAPKEVVADEPWLVEKFGATPEQLYWRRLTIADKTDGDVDKFRQEYPATPQEMFVGTGRHVFSVKLQRSAIDSAEHFDKRAEEGIFLASGYRTRRVPNGTVEVPTGAIWVPREKTGHDDDYPFWRVWLPREHEQEVLSAPAATQYVAAVDPAGTNATSANPDPDSWAIQVIDHHSLAQAAVWRGRLDTDKIAEQAYLAGLFFNLPIMAVEVTGGWGNPLVDDFLNVRYGYPRLYRREKPLFAKDESASQATKTALGWSTNRQTKPQLLEGFRELLREHTHGVKDMATALQITTFVWNDRGSAGADVTAHDDLLMAYMIAQQVARLVRPRPKMSPRTTSSVPARMRRR